MTGDERSDPLSDVLNIFAAPLAGTIRSFDQFRKGVDEFLRGVENFNRTMETMNETAQRINVLLGEVEEPIKAAIPQITRTVKLADEVMQVVSGPAVAAAPALRQLSEIMSTPGIGQLPAQLRQFTEVMTDMSKRLGPLTQFAESAGGLFGGLRFPGATHHPAQHQPAQLPPLGWSASSWRHGRCRPRPWPVRIHRRQLPRPRARRRRLRRSRPPRSRPPRSRPPRSRRRRRSAAKKSTARRATSTEG